ncbi:MAG: GDSL-type esterase/lipase family protein [Treponema sp.]|uniref:SGNH/GDSL hydrolase family protein n=1 Tax=Treponema sp. TaxID=166 RepID=UPI00298E144C|nr:GDSL-type esterase/lipase family protein [Treponema sp.]MDD5812347.1 GDSL-type esterase/lipase family protein [Treponema sp.]
MSEIKSVIVWGDSILKGIISSEDLTQIRPSEINALQMAGEKLAIEINNKSIYGAHIIKLQSTQTKNLNKGLTADIALIESGTNDCDYEWNDVCTKPFSEITQKVPLADFKRIASEMVDTSRENKITPVLVTAPDLAIPYWKEYITRGLDKEKIAQFIGDDPYVLLRNQEEYMEALRQIAKEKNVQLIDMRVEFRKTSDPMSLMCKDGVHPNIEGHKLMADVFVKLLPEIKKEF